MRYLWLALLTVLALTPLTTQADENRLLALEQQALREAAAQVADSVVQIRTIGGLDRVGRTLLSTGPTTGLIVSEDGYIVSSAFNFAGQPSSILVRLANGQQLAAELVARDKNRMLVLLKVDTDNALPTPTAAELDGVRVGQWAVAVGRTFQSDNVGVSVGIVSATNRKYGRMIQTDANVSVANYGGPLIDINGDVLGVLVPMSPQDATGESADEVAGAQYYDSGIGFAVPLTHVLQVLERWKQGTDLLPGKLGIGLAEGDAHVTPPKITSVWPKSPAAQAGWKSDDVIAKVDSVAVSTQAQLRFQILPRYAGDSLSVTLDRDGEQIETSITLTDELAPYRSPFLGVLPERTPDKDQPTGAPIRKVWPDSPAADAGLMAGDVITKIDETKLNSTRAARNVLRGLRPDEAIKLEISRGDETLQLSATLSKVPEEVLATDAAANNNDVNAAADAKLEELKVPEFSQAAKYFHPNAEKATPSGLVIWLGDSSAETNQATFDDWRAVCRRDGLILLVASPAEESGWSSDDLGYLQQLTRLATRRLKIDRQRMVVVGSGKAGQLAYALAMQGRTTLSGVISIDAPLPRTLTPRDTSPRNQLAVLSIESINSSFAPLIRRDVQTLRDAGYPVTILQKPLSNDNTIDAATQQSIEHWIDGLDRY